MRPALRLLWALGVRHLVAHRARLLLSTVGIGAGVALAVAVAALGSSIDASLAAVAESAASRANLEVRPHSDTGLPPELLGRIRDLEGVSAAGATVESYTLFRRGDRTERTLLLGVDSGLLELSPRAFDESVVEEADPFGLFLPPPVAARLGVAQGDELEVATPAGWRPAVVGLVIPAEVAARSRVVVGAIGVVQGLLGRGEQLDAIYVEAADPEAAARAIGAMLGDAGQVGPPAFRQDEVRQLLTATETSLNVAALVALFVGAFLVYNTMAMAAVERIREAALMRAVGARRRQVFGLFLAEGGLLGLAGSLIGLGGGVLLAAAVFVRRGSMLEQVFPIEVSSIVVRPRDLVVATVAGITAAVLASWLPARRVAHSDPAPALGPVGAFEDPTQRPARLTGAIGVLLCAGAVVLALIGLRSATLATGILLTAFTVFLAGVALLVRTLVPVLARVLLWGALRERSRAPGLLRLASGEILRSPGRTAFTVGAMFLALSLVVGFSVAQSSFARTFELRFDEVLRADLYVRSATWRPFGADVPLDARIAEDLREVPGVAVAYPFRIDTTTVDGRIAVIIAYDFDAYARLPGLDPQWRAEAAELARLARAPGTMVVSPSVPQQLGYGVGDTLDLPTPAGTRPMTVVGVIEDPSAVTPELFLDHGEYSRLWGRSDADTFPIGLEPGADPAAVASDIERRFGETLGLEVDTRQEYFDRINSFVRGTLDLIGSLQLVAVIVAGLGLANTLLISTLERRRDLGVLRAVGMLRRQVRRMVALEAVLIGVLGVLGAWALGTVIGWSMQTITESQLGMRMERVYPLWGYLAAGALGVVGAGLAALYPAHRAARVDVVDALQYE